MTDGSRYLLHKPDTPNACSSVSQCRKGNGDVILEVPASFLHSVVSHLAFKAIQVKVFC